MRRLCCWCRQPLVQRPGEPWVHEATGKSYVTYIGQDGKERDDHCGLPDWSDSGAVEQDDARAV